MAKTFKGGVSTVEVNALTGIVRKTYALEYDSVFDSPYGLATSELVILNLLDGADGFPKLIDFELAPPNYTIVMNYVGTRIKPADKPLELFTQILKRVATLHANHIVHCDLKPENIMIDGDGKVSIIDFSHSYLAINKKLSDYLEKKERAVSGKHMSIYIDDTYTTRLYCAPENYIRFTPKSSACDIWSLGCVLYEIITGRNFFCDDLTINADQPTHGSACDDKVLEMIKKKFNDAEWMRARIGGISDPVCARILRDTLALDPLSRPTVAQLLKEYVGVDYEAPIIFANDCDLSGYYGHDKRRMTCFNLPEPIHYFTGQMIEKLLRDMCNEKTSASDERNGRDVTIAATYNKREPAGKYSAYRIYYMAHMIAHMLFYDKYCEPYDVLYGGCEYMTMLRDIVGNYRMSFIFRKIGW